ncbi:MAG: methyltransferase [Planctomycetota bacterium]|nr:methyltransferase [Planctomycetota bacterium]
MNSRERLLAALNHQQPDRVPVDFGSTAVTGIHVSVVTRLRRAVLGDGDYRVKVIEPYQMLGEVDEELRKALGIDVIGIAPRKTLFGFENKNFKPFTMFDGTEVLVPENFNTTADTNGDLLIYPEGDTAVPPSGRMPKGGHFFDSIIRQAPIDDDKLDPADNCEEFGPLSDADLSYYQRSIDRLSTQTDAGIMLTMPGTAFGDIALVPAPWMKHPKGIRDVEEWYISTISRKDYVRKVFEAQCEIALKNIQKLINLFGNRIHATFLTGTDFGTQRGPFISVKAYRDLFKPFHKQVNDLIHQNTMWKTFIHSCGSVFQLVPDFIEAGFDILNPVQCSAAQMDPVELKRRFGKDVTFWGGGVDTQHTLAFASAEEVYREVRRRVDIFNEGGGFVFDTIHNIQANTPTENILALFRALQDSAG